MFRVDEILASKGPADRAPLLGFLGLIPFVLGAVAAWFGTSFFSFEIAEGAVIWTMFYGAVIVSFLTGTRWGGAIAAQRPERLLMAVAPALMAWGALVPTALTGGLAYTAGVRVVVLIIAFSLTLILELASKEWEVATGSSDYGRMRISLTGFALGLLVLMMLGARSTLADVP